jgi:hypothetical protein
MHRTTARTPWGSQLVCRLSTFFLSIIIAFSLGLGPGFLMPVYAHDIGNAYLEIPPGANPADPQVDEQIEQAWHPDYLKLATGDPNLLDHGVYAWPFALDSIGWSMQSFQDYGGTPYFHHGMDMMKIYGTQVYNMSGGQVINIENYQPGWDLYWEVAILDPYGYIWQYHHIDEPTIPQQIWDAYHAYLADPINGGFIPPITHLGNIVYWPVWSFDKQFNHIHLNILAEGGVYVNGFEFHTPLPDTLGPEIQAVGLLQNGQPIVGNSVEGEYSLYVRARDLILDNVYYLPPWEIKFSVDGGPEHITWRFDQLPGGADDTAYLDDFYVVPPTCGDYECRDYYIDLGFIPGSQYQFPHSGWEHTVLVTVSDYAGNSTSQSFTYTVLGTPPGIIYWQDDFESNLGWVLNPDGYDTATAGQWERANPEQTYSAGPKQLGNTPSGVNDLVTGHLAGANANSYDIDGGITSIRSPQIILPVADGLTLSFRYYLAHGGNSSNLDYLRFTILGAYQPTVLEEVGAPENDDGLWLIENVDISEFSGQSIYLYVDAADMSGDSLVEAAIDDVLIFTNHVNQAPIADGQSLSTDEDTALDIVLTGSDPEGAPITFTVVTTPTHGSLSGVVPHLTYTPAPNYNGPDSFTFVVSDGQQNSEPAEVAIDVLPVNDAPMAYPQSITVYQDRSVPIKLTGSDVDGDPLSFQVMINPQHGTLDGTGPDVIYTPEPGYFGADNFAFITNDGELDSEPAEVGITIYPVLFVPMIFR